MIAFRLRTRSICKSVFLFIILFQYNRMSFRKLQFRVSIHTCLLFYLLSLLVNTLNNLITPLDNLTPTLSQTSTSQFPYNYQQLPNTPTWHSLTSATLLLRNLPSMPTSSIALDTANNNRYNKICYPFSSLQVSKYQLSFKYLIDGNTDRAKLVVTWNTATVLQKIVSHVYVMQETYFVNGKGDGTDIMCLEGWAYNDLLFYGVLVYDFVVAKIVDVYVLFDARIVQDQLNTIQLVSNLTVNDSNSLSIFQSYTTLQIPAIKYTLLKISLTQLSKLSLTISIQSQPPSNPGAQPQILLPTHRNPQLNLQQYIITSKTLPRVLYISETDVQFLNDTLQYVLLVTRVYNVAYRLVRLFGFAFVGVRLWAVQIVFGGLAWLDVGAIGGHVRRILTQIMKNSQYSKTFGYFMSQLNIQSYNFGSQQIKISQPIPFLPPRSPTFTTSFLSPSLPQLLTDNLILSLLNILKLYILTSWIYNNSPEMKKLLTYLKSHKIHYQFTTILYLPVLVTFLRLAHGMGMYCTIGRINFGVGVAAVGVGICGVLGAMWGEWVILGKRVRKIKGKLGRKLSQINQNLNTYYRNRIALNICDGLIFLLIPATIGFYNTYLTLSLTLLLLILKLKLCLQCLNLRPSFYQFLWFLAIIIQVSIVVCYFVAHLISSFPILPSEIQLPWLLIIRYYSLSLPFLYLAVGFIYFVMMMWEMGLGVLVAWRMLRCKARVANLEMSHQIVISGEHMILDEAYRQSLDEIGSGITIVNKLRDKVDKCTQKSISIPYGIDSQQKISNPFVSTHLPKQALKPPPKQKPRKKSQEKNLKNFSSLHQPAKKVRGSQEKRLKIVTMKGIQPAAQEQQQDRTRCKSSYGEEADGKLQKSKRKTNLKKADEIMSKSMKLIKKLDLSKAVKLETIGTEKTNKQVFQSNFEKEEAFS